MDSYTETEPSRTTTREWYPMRLTTTIRPMVHGGRALSERLGRGDLPRWSIAESWEVCDSSLGMTYVTNGRFSGWSLHDLTNHHGAEVLGTTGATRFPMFAKLLDATGVGPLQMECPSDPDRPPRSTAWHVVDAPPGSVARCGVLDGVGAQQLHDAIMDQDFDSVLRQVPLRPGSTLCVPEGTLYCFGPQTLLYALSPVAPRTVSAARWHDEDGSTVSFRHWRESIGEIMRDGDLASAPMTHSGRPIQPDRGVHRVGLADLDGLVLERLEVAAGRRTRLDSGSATVLTNVGAPATLAHDQGHEVVEGGRTLLLPAMLRPVHLDGPADVLLARPQAPAG